MNYRVLGRTGIPVSVVAFGAGPVSGLMTGADAEAQNAVVARAIAAGINWFDTAPGYGQGQSEANIGRVLEELGAARRVHIATKVRLPSDAPADVVDLVRRSVADSLERLRLPRVTLLQLHNGITNSRGEEPSSITPSDVLAPGGVADAFRKVREEGLVGHFGLTGTGQPAAVRTVMASGEFDTIQVPYHLLNPSAGADRPTPGETDYGNILADCASKGIAAFAIRVFAGGALLGQPPSGHTLKTPYFPLDLYRRDLARAERLAERVAGRMPLTELAVRFALAHSAACSAIIGFGSPGQIDDVTTLPVDRPLPADLVAAIMGGSK
ncbi:MAG TPA: aldo/keto reductase [Gemmataceae bacterium]|nr:aldo/keto reductase [Gemmataceae bacterium]